MYVTLQAGGRAQTVQHGAFRFDTGPSLLLFPDTYRQASSRPLVSIGGARQMCLNACCWHVKLKRMHRPGVGKRPRA